VEQIHNPLEAMKLNVTLARDLNGTQKRPERDPRGIRNNQEWEKAKLSAPSERLRAARSKSVVTAATKAK